MALPLVDNIFMNRYSTETGRRFSTEGATRPKSYMGYIPTQDLDKLHIQRGDVKTLLERGYNGLGRVNGSKTEGRGQHNGGKDGIVSENRLQNGEEGSCEAEKRLQNETKRYMENRLQNEDHSNDIGQRMLYRTEHSNTDGQRMLQKIEHSNDTEKRQHKEVTYTPSNNTKMHNNKNPILQTPNLPHTQHPFPDNTAETTPEYTVRLRRELQPKNAETEAKSFVKPREPSRKESTGYARPHSFIDNIGCYTFQNNYRFINGTPKADPSSTVFSAQPCDTASLGKVNTGGFDKRCAGLKGGVGTDLLVKDSTSSPVKPITKSFGKTATSFTEKPTTNSSVKPITTSAVKATTTYSYRPNIDYPILETTTSYSTGLQSRLEAKKGLSTVTQSKLEDTPVLSDLPQSRKESIEAFCYKNQDRQESVKEGYKTCHFDPTVNSAYQKAATGSTTFETPLLIKNASTTSSKSVPVGSDLSFSTNFSTNSTDFSTNLTNYSTNPSVPTLPSKPISINFLSDSKDSEVSTQNITTGFPQFSTKSPQHLQDTLLRNHDARDAPRRPFSCFDMILLNTMKPAIEVTSLSSGTLIDSKGSSSSNSCLSLVSEESGCDDIVLGDVEDTDVVSGISNNRRLEEKSTSDLCMPEKARFDWKDNSTSQFKPTETTKDRLKPEENSQEALRQSKSLSTVYTKPAGPASDEKRKLWHEHAKRFQSCTGSSDLQSSDKAFRKLSADGDKAFRVLVDPEAECYEQPRSFSNFESCRSSQSPRPRMVRGMNAVTLDRRIKKAPFKSPALSERNFQSPDGMRTEAKKNKILRRHSNHQTRVSGASPDSDSHVMRELLVRQDNGLEMAFERCKAWSKYASHLLQFVRSRLVMEHEHARNVAKLAEQTKNLLYADANNNPLPLVGVFDELMESQVDMTTRTEHLVNLLNQRFIATLENRQKDHDHKRRKLKNEWTKQKKQLEQCEEELRRARQNLNMKEGGYMKARDHMIRQVQSVPSRPVVDANRQKKEIEKRRRNEETALNRKTEAENEVWKLERELDERRRAVQELRLITIDELCDLIRHCDLTTTACASHYVKAFADLWTLLPQEYNRLAHAIRESSPGSEYMSFLQSLPGRSISSASLLRGSTSTAGGGDKPDEDFANSSLSMATSSGESAPSSARRRNALNAEEHIDYIAETSSRRQKKSMTRIFDQSLNHVEQSDAAKSHQLQRTRQVTRCAHCEHLVIFDAVKCTICGIVWHKKCLPLLSVVCGPSAHRLTAESAGNRRMSIFGVPLIGHLQAQRRQVPIILEKCIDELQKRGMNCKGLYRTCGVKSKIEQICVQFEQAGEDANVDLSEVHPMNLASVVKLYLRKLPEPLMTYELYKDWLDVDTSDIAESKEVLKGLCDRLPQQNYDTFKFLLMHLRRVSWFELENLMTPANLAAVISPSLIWNRSSNTGPSTPTSFSSSSTGTGAQNSFINDAHQQTKIVEHLIQYVYDIFEDDMSADWKKFFEAYPDVEEPKQADPETEAKLTKDSAKPEFTLDDEDELNDYDIDDEAQGSIQELSLPEANFPMPRNSFASPSTCRLPGTAGDKHKLGKQRSFTTSILVSPQSDRKVILNSNKPSYSDRKLSEDQTQRTLKSGEVVVEIRKNQYCMPEYNAKGSTEAGRDSRKSSGQSHLNRNFGGSTLAISGDFPHVDDDVDEEPGRQRSATSRRASAHKPDDERVCLQNVGVIFSGNDVSYV